MNNEKSNFGSDDTSGEETKLTRRDVIGAGALGIAAGALAGSAILQGSVAQAQTNTTPARPATSTGSEVTYSSGGVAIKGYLAKPAGNVQSRGAAIIVIHEIWGLNEHIRDIARRFASQGYTALAPDLFRGEMPPKVEGNNFKPVLDFLANIPDARMVGDLEAAIAYLKAGGSARVGSVGFCMGGLYSYQLATTSPNLSAAVDFYGRIVYPETNEKKPNSPLDLANQLKCPLLGHFGELDTGIPIADVEKLRDRLRGSNQPWKINIYPGANHAFFNDTRPSFDKAAAADAWQETLDFFKNHLTVPAG